MTKLAVFIDADNFSDCTALDHAMEAVRDLGEQVIFKHAYGNAASLKSIEVVLAKYGIRPISNLVVGKTTTDAALAIGAIEAICRNPDIRVAVICSGDADFAPLAVRLHELNCKSICIGLHGNVFRSADAFYDEVIEIKVVESNAPLNVPMTVVQQPLGQQVVKASSATSAMMPKAAIILPSVLTKTPITPTLAPVSIKQVLIANPALKTGQWLAMSVVVRALREKKMIGANTSLKQWLEPIQSQFEVMLAPGKANQIRYKAVKPKEAQAASQSSKQKVTTQQILQVCPALEDKQWIPLGAVVKGLRDQKHLSQSTKLKGWLPPLSASFEWQPTAAPNQIRWRGK